MKFKRKSKLFTAVAAMFTIFLTMGAISAGAYTGIDPQINGLQQNDKASDAAINVQNCNIIISPSDSMEFKYDYDNTFCQVSEKAENGSITITVNPVTGTLGEFDFSKDTRIRIYVPEQSINKLSVTGEHAGISVLPLQTDIELTNHNGAARVYLDKQFSKKLDFTSTDGSGALNLQEGLRDYRITASVIGSAFSPAKGMPDFQNHSLPYTFVSGNGTASINLDLQHSAFAIDPYSGEAADLLKTRFDIVTQNK